ncbi:MAG: sulfotransferase family 2 domain-containing protein, partial [Planctomycetes bacterium]|nr:sulfotransferase family 2 domain-containing protein [Planctomycetota bacterium]
MGKLVRAGKSILNHILKREGPQRPRVLFLHIQKTAGSSIVELARDHYDKSVISHGDFGGHKPEDFQDVAFVSGHFGYEFARPLMSDRYSFTFLRDPVDRVLSFYYFCRRMDSNEFEIYSLAQGL